MILTAMGVRLGASMRETEDELIRDMLAGTAAMVNCVGGINGKSVAVVKPSLIDLEAEA